MQSSYSLPPRRALIVRLSAALFLLVAAISVLGTVAAMVRPVLSVHCGAGGCSDRTRLLDLAPEEARASLAASGEAQARFAAHVRLPAVRAGLAGVRLIDGLPFAALMLAVGMALRRLAAGGGDELARALPWLRGASIIAVLMALAGPLAESLQAMLLFPGTPAGAMWYFALDMRQLALDLLLAAAAFAVVWALDAGSRAQRDLADFV
jgi:hypothetical protein